MAEVVSGGFLDQLLRNAAENNRTADENNNGAGESVDSNPNYELGRFGPVLQLMARQHCVSARLCQSQVDIEPAERMLNAQVEFETIKMMYRDLSDAVRGHRWDDRRKKIQLGEQTDWGITNAHLIMILYCIRKHRGHFCKRREVVREGFIADTAIELFNESAMPSTITGHPGFQRRLGDIWTLTKIKARKRRSARSRLDD